ncbi:Uncharacterized protein, DUF1810 family [Microbulbifer donghaiensis]|uniref:Uncharacterized protein, DUF1810 family n=2 Tax=Microbulbifer donghaiensis TaxID=494016 RepID=A0A1M4W254_9GAMM|nr:Uncharacterized protein, DUF1810 family [Microbulbifer donghaiensis]
MSDPFDLQRFVEAQSHNYDAALAELSAGQKRSHWMWYIFPQFRGLGHSAMAQRYAIKDLEEARAYLDHPVLGPRLKDCCEQLLQVEGRSAHEIMGSPDDIKLRSSMTLFSVVEDGSSVFDRVLNKYYDGQPDSRSLEIINDLDQS